MRRSRRAAFDSGFSKSGVSVFRPVQNREALTLALDLVKSSSQWGSHLRRHTLSIMLSINYQLPPAQSESDPLHLAVINDQLVRILQAAESGTPLVELLPFLRYVPSRYAKLITADYHTLKGYLFVGSRNGNGKHRFGIPRVLHCSNGLRIMFRTIKRALWERWSTTRENTI